MALFNFSPISISFYLAVTIIFFLPYQHNSILLTFKLDLFLRNCFLMCFCDLLAPYYPFFLCYRLCYQIVMISFYLAKLYLLTSYLIKQYFNLFYEILTQLVMFSIFAHDFQVGVCNFKQSYLSIIIFKLEHNAFWYFFYWLLLTIVANCFSLSYLSFIYRY